MIRRLLYALAAICLLTAGCSSNSTADVTTPADNDTVQVDSAATSEQSESAALMSFSATTLDGNTFTQDDSDREGCNHHQFLGNLLRSLSE